MPPPLQVLPGPAWRTAYEAPRWGSPHADCMCMWLLISKAMEVLAALEIFRMLTGCHRALDFNNVLGAAPSQEKARVTLRVRKRSP